MADLIMLVLFCLGIVGAYWSISGVQVSKRVENTVILLSLACVLILAALTPIE